MLRVSPTTAPAHVQVYEGKLASITHPVNPAVEVGVPKVPLPLVPIRSTVTVMSPVVRAVNGDGDTDQPGKGAAHDYSFSILFNSRLIPIRTSRKSIMHLLNDGRAHRGTMRGKPSGGEFETCGHGGV